MTSYWNQDFISSLKYTSIKITEYLLSQYFIKTKDFFGSSSCLPRKRLLGNTYSRILKKPIWTEKLEQNMIINKIVFKITETSHSSKSLRKSLEWCWKTLIIFVKFSQTLADPILWARQFNGAKFSGGGNVHAVSKWIPVE